MFRDDDGGNDFSNGICSISLVEKIRKKGTSFFTIFAGRICLFVDFISAEARGENMKRLKEVKIQSQIVKREQRGFQKRYRRAVYTVESAFIIPMIVILTALLIVLNFYIHNRVWYTCAAYETALQGNSFSAGESINRKRKAEETAKKRIQDQGVPGLRPDASIRWSQKQTEVSFQGRLFTIFRGKIPSLQVKCRVRRVNPERSVRFKWIAKHLSGR